MSDNENQRFILKLFELFSNLLKILEREGKGEVDFAIKEVKYIVEILNDCILNNYCEDNKTIKEVKEIHSSLYPPKGGLSEFFVWRNDFDERIKINDYLDNIKEELWKLLT